MNTFMILGLDFFIIFLLIILLVKIEKYELELKKIWINNRWLKGLDVSIDKLVY
ncbi:hypothetical protein JJB76_14655 [Clostridium perfringens]|uniref:hypothetical protein n=1 Tax=Clostridium perfringens TaxID=1502 RepID=UPI001ABAB517|nr:hypothetical protein [Clostridium perfringens]MBO3307673.1 hypothetical protein [Clostridium perfringens]